MVKWEALNRPKEYRGLGFMDVIVINICLMCKWIDKLERGEKSISCELPRRKILKRTSFK